MCIRDVNIECQKGDDNHGILPIRNENWPVTNDICHWSLANSHFSLLKWALCPDVSHHFFCDEGFDRVADLHIVEVLNAYTAFVAACDFGSILFETLQ